MRSVVRIQSPGKQLARKETGHRGQWVDAFFGAWLIAAPFAGMLFRPEEIHGASGIGQIVEPVSEWNGGVSNDFLRLGILDGTVLHLYPDGGTAIQAGRIDPYCLSGKQPADRQRFEASLSGPLLLAFNRDAVLGGNMAEGRE